MPKPAVFHATKILYVTALYIRENCYRKYYEYNI